MGSSIKINSISIDLADAANEINMVKCNHFSIRGFVAETRVRDQRKCWPFSEESSVGLVEKLESYSLPSLSVPKFRWWRCISCIKDIDVNGTKDCGHSNSRTISEIKLDRTSSAIQIVAATTFLKKLNSRTMDTCIVRSKCRKLMSPKQVSNKKSKEKINISSMDISSCKEKQIVDQTMPTLGSSEIAGVIEDKPSKSIKNHDKGSNVVMECDNVSSENINLKLHRRKTRKVRLLSELLSKTNTRTSDGIREEDSASKHHESVRGKKRKLLPDQNNYVISRILSTTTDQCNSESTDSGFDRDPIKGKKRNTRFQVVDEFVQSLPCETSLEGIHENGKDLVPCLLSTQRTENKLSLVKMKKKKTLIDNKKSNLISFAAAMDEGKQVKPRTGPPINAISEGCFRHYTPQLNDNDHVRSRDGEADCIREFGSSSKSKTSVWLRTGVDASRVPTSQSHDTKEKTPEEQNDDIPMEIVELMAKNQYERCLPDKEEEQPSQETTHKSKNGLLIDLNETYDNDISQEDNSNARKGEQHYTIENQQKSLEFFPLTQPYVPPSPFGTIFPPNQENQATSISFSGHNSQWLGNVPTMANQNPSPSSFRVLQTCNTCQSVPHQYREAPHKPVSFNVDPSAKPFMLSQASSNINTWNLNFVAANEKQKCGPSSEFLFGCKHTAQVNNNNRPMDSFSSESSIPALHLLSLMDPRLRSSTPVNHHGNTKFTKRHFPPINQAKEFIEVQREESSKTTYQTKQLPFEIYNKRFDLETSPSFGTFQASWSHHQEKKIKKKDTTVSIDSRSKNDQRKFQLLGASNSMMLPLKFHMKDKEKKQNRKANVSVWPPLKNSSGPIVCRVNRNPADFTIPEPGNVYMITSENLKIRKRATFKKKTSLCKQEALNQSKKPVSSATEHA